MSCNCKCEKFKTFEKECKKLAKKWNINIDNIKIICFKNFSSKKWKAPAWVEFEESRPIAIVFVHSRNKNKDIKEIKEIAKHEMLHVLLSEKNEHKLIDKLIEIIK